MDSDKLITFGQLLKIKREALGLTLLECEKQMKITTLSGYERGKYKPGQKILAKLVAFFKITEEELKSLKTSSNIHVDIKSSQRLTTLIKNLGQSIQELAHLPDQGLLAKNLKKDALEQLNMAHECMTNVVIIDRLL